LVLQNKDDNYSGGSKNNVFLQNKYGTLIYKGSL